MSKNSKAKQTLEDLFLSQRIAVFVDVQSLYYSCKDMYEEDEQEYQVDYLKLLEEVVQGRTLVRAGAYLMYVKESDTHSFHRALNEKGFEVRSKPTVDYKKRPLSWVTGMSLDMLQMKDKVDLAILVTHDDDFSDAFAHLDAHGVPVEVWGFDGFLGSVLKQSAAKFHFLPRSILETKAPRRNSYEGEEDVGEYYVDE